jgi:hypothetical protein
MRGTRARKNAARCSALFFFALPLQHRANADAHRAFLTQRRFLEAVLITTRPQKQTRARRRPVEVAFTEIAVEALQTTRFTGRRRRVLCLGSALRFRGLDGHSPATIALQRALGLAHARGAVGPWRSFRRGCSRLVGDTAGAIAAARVTRTVGHAAGNRQHFHDVHVSNFFFFGL